MKTYMAQMDTEHFTFHAFGLSEADARAVMATTFAEHVRRYAPDGDEPFAWWSEGGQEPTANMLHDYYGIAVIPALVGRGFVDYSEVKTGDHHDVSA